MNLSEEIIAKTMQYGANNYASLPIVISHAEGVWVEDPEGNRYMDMLSAYSALSHGHRHPRIIEALKRQADKVTLTSRAFHHEQMGELYELLFHLTHKACFLLMNTGVEAVETAIKAARRWAYEVKKVQENQAEMIVCAGNFHGRTITVTSFSSEASYRRGFGPFTPGFITIPFGDLQALEQVITANTAGFLVEPMQGEAGIIIPEVGYLREAQRICKDRQVLLLADEIQTGLGRTGKRFACDWDEVVPDIYILGKALGGGVLPVSAVAAGRDILGIFEPGSHGSTFGGNPLACAVAIASLQVLEDEALPERSLKLGAYLLQQLKKMNNPLIRDIRGRGLFIAIELTVDARPFCESLMKLGLLCKETHRTVIRLTPPLTITKDELDWAIERIDIVLNKKLRKDVL